MQPVPGPVGPAGWQRSAAGTLLCCWSCVTCGKAANNSSRLFELLRSPCGVLGEWRQLRHSVVRADGKTSCSRCGTARQQHVQLETQRCPVRAHFQGGIEVPAATAVYAAWQRTVSAMHACTRAAAFGLGAAPSAEDAPAEARAPGAEPEAVTELAPRRATLRPFRSHACFTVAEVEACMKCFMRAPRYRISAWRAGCCDGNAPIGACPKHILAAVMTSATVWPVGHEARGRDLSAAAKAFGSTLAAKALRPPKRRQPRMGLVRSEPPRIAFVVEPPVLRRTGRGSCAGRLASFLLILLVF